MDPQVVIYHFKEFCKQQYPDVRSVKVYNERLVEFSDTAPTILLLRENFLLKINEEWYSVISETEDPLFSVKADHTLSEKTIFALCQNAGYSLRQTATLGKFISSLANDLSDHKHNQVDSHIIKAITEKNLYERAIEAKNHIEQIDNKLNFLRKKLADFEELASTAEAKLLVRAKKRLKWFSGLIFTQLLAIQYGTYVAFSWDVMEPITCLLGILDVIIAYSFWLSTNRAYSFNNIGLNYIESRRKKAYRKIGIDTEEIEETKNLIKLLETQKLLLSPKVEDLLQGLQLVGELESGKAEEEEDE